LFLIHTYATALNGSADTSLLMNGDLRQERARPKKPLHTVQRLELFALKLA